MYLENAGKHGYLHGLRPSSLCDAVHVGAELIEQMVDNLRRENPDLYGHRIREVLRCVREVY